MLNYPRVPDTKAINYVQPIECQDQLQPQTNFILRINKIQDMEISEKTLVLIEQAVKLAICAELVFFRPIYQKMKKKKGFVLKNRKMFQRIQVLVRKMTTIHIQVCNVPELDFFSVSSIYQESQDQNSQYQARQVINIALNLQKRSKLEQKLQHEYLQDRYLLGQIYTNYEKKGKSKSKQEQEQSRYQQYQKTNEYYLKLQKIKARINQQGYNPYRKYILNRFIYFIQKLIQRQLDNDNKEIQETQCTTFMDIELERPNFSLKSLKQRNFFFLQEIIIPEQNDQTKYLSDKFLLEPQQTLTKAHYQSLKKHICAFLNSLGGAIYIGIKKPNCDPNNYQIRYVLGQYYSQDNKKQVKASILNLLEQITPFINPKDIKIQFIPVRSKASQQLTLLHQHEKYFYDFSYKLFDINQYPHIQSYYVVRIIVPSQQSNIIYTYTEQQGYKLNQKTKSKQFISFRRDSKTIVKEIFQHNQKQLKSQVLKDKQTETQKYQYSYHNDDEKQYINPQITYKSSSIDIKNKINITKIQKCLNEKINEKQYYTDTQQFPTGIKDDGISKNFQNNNQQQCHQSQQQPVYFVTKQKKSKDQAQQQIYFYVSGISGELKGNKLQACFKKTPTAIYKYGRIEKFDSQRMKDSIWAIVIKEGQYQREAFEPVRAEIQKYFNSKIKNFEKQRQNLVQIIQVSCEIAIQSDSKRKDIETRIKQRNDQCTVGCKTLKFQSQWTAIQYFSQIKKAHLI